MPKLGEPKFKIGDTVEFTENCDLDYYQEREEEVRGRTVKKWTKGTVKKVIPHSKEGWSYAVHLENTEYAWMNTPEVVIQWYDNYMDQEAASIVYNEKAQKVYDLYIDHAFAFINNNKVHGDIPDERLMRAVENAIDIPAWSFVDFRASIVSKHLGRLKLSRYTPRWHEDAAMYKAIPILLEQIEAGWRKNPTITTLKTDKCTCSIDTLMASGCQCGHLEKKNGKS